MFLNLVLVFLGGWTYADMIADPPAAAPAVHAPLPIRSEGGQVARPAVSPAAATTPPALAYWPPGTPRHPACDCGGGGCNCSEAGKCTVIDSDCEPGIRRAPTASIAPLPVPAVDGGPPVNSLKEPSRVVRSFREGIPPDSITGRRLAEIEAAWVDEHGEIPRPRPLAAPLPVPAVVGKAQSPTACLCGGDGCSCVSREGRMYPACTLVGGSCVQGKAGPPVVPAVVTPPPVVYSTVAPVTLWQLKDRRGVLFRHANKSYLERWVSWHDATLAPPVVTTYYTAPPVYQYALPAVAPSYGGFTGSFGFGGGYSGGGSRCGPGGCR